MSGLTESNHKMPTSLSWYSANSCHMNSYLLGSPPSPEARPLEVGGDLAAKERHETEGEEHRPAQHRARDGPGGAEPLPRGKQEEAAWVKAPRHSHAHRDQDQTLVSRSARPSNQTPTALTARANHRPLDGRSGLLSTQRWMGS